MRASLPGAVPYEHVFLWHIPLMPGLLACRQDPFSCQGKVLSGASPFSPFVVILFGCLVRFCLLFFYFLPIGR